MGAATKLCGPRAGAVLSWDTPKKANIKRHFQSVEHWKAQGEGRTTDSEVAATLAPFLALADDQHMTRMMIAYWAAVHPTVLRGRHECF